jgi:hypothetical protein
MDLPVLRIIRLLEEAIERREMDELKREATPYIENAEIRKKFQAWRSRNPLVNTTAALAQLAKMDSSHVRRMLGLAPTSPIVRHGECYEGVFTVLVMYPGRTLTTIHRDKAAKLIQAMGIAPVTVEGL